MIPESAPRRAWPDPRSEGVENFLVRPRGLVVLPQPLERLTPGEAAHARRRPRRATVSRWGPSSSRFGGRHRSLEGLQRAVLLGRARRLGARRENHSPSLMRPCSEVGQRDDFQVITGLKLKLPSNNPESRKSSDRPSFDRSRRGVLLELAARRSAAVGWRARRASPRAPWLPARPAPPASKPRRGSTAIASSSRARNFPSPFATARTASSLRASSRRTTSPSRAYASARLFTPSTAELIDPSSAPRSPRAPEQRLLLLARHHERRRLSRRRPPSPSALRRSFPGPDRSSPWSTRAGVEARHLRALAAIGPFELTRRSRR